MESKRITKTILDDTFLEWCKHFGFDAVAYVQKSGQACLHGEAKYYVIYKYAGQWVTLPPDNKPVPKLELYRVLESMIEFDKLTFPYRKSHA